VQALAGREGKGNQGNCLKGIRGVFVSRPIALRKSCRAEIAPASTSFLSEGNGRPKNVRWYARKRTDLGRREQKTLVILRMAKFDRDPRIADISRFAEIQMD